MVPSSGSVTGFCLANFFLGFVQEKIIFFSFAGGALCLLNCAGGTHTPLCSSDTPRGGSHRGVGRNRRARKPFSSSRGCEEGGDQDEIDVSLGGFVQQRKCPSIV